MYFLFSLLYCVAFNSTVLYNTVTFLLWDRNDQVIDGLYPLCGFLYICILTVLMCFPLATTTCMCVQLTGTTRTHGYLSCVIFILHGRDYQVRVFFFLYTNWVWYAKLNNRKNKRCIQHAQESSLSSSSSSCRGMACLPVQCCIVPCRLDQWQAFKLFQSTSASSSIVSHFVPKLSRFSPFCVGLLLVSSSPTAL